MAILIVHLFNFQELLQLIGPGMIGTKKVFVEKRTLALSKGSLHHFLTNFCKLMTSRAILSQLIQWPKTESEFRNIAGKFSARAGFPNVIGAVDGTYIPIPGPPLFRDSYICRKGYPAMHLQAVCDSDLRFLDVFSAYPGSVHDSRVFKNSPLFQELQSQNFPTQYHLLGDSAYGLSNVLIVPFRDNGHLLPEEKRFNSAHSSTRVDIERSFGLLKGKFRKLKFLDMRKVEDIPSVIITCCGLHNLILSRESFTTDDIDIDGDDSGNVTSETAGNCVQENNGRKKRNEIMNLLV